MTLGYFVEYMSGDENTDRSRDLFWDRNKPKALLATQNYEHPGKAAYAIIDEAFHLSKEPSDIEFKSHLNNTVTGTVTISQAYEDEVINEFFEIVEELTDVNISTTKTTSLEDDFLGDNKQFRVDIQFEEHDENSFLDRLR